MATVEWAARGGRPAATSPAITLSLSRLSLALTSGGPHILSCTPPSLVDYLASVITRAGASQ